MSEIEEKSVLLNAWVEVIKKDIENLSADREIKFKEYKRTKEIYDKRTSSKLKIVNKVDKFINERKKALGEVEAEIRLLTEVPPVVDLTDSTGSLETPPSLG